MSDTDILLHAMLDLSAGDRSMLEAASSGRLPHDARLNTSLGSPNFKLWSLMVEKGWMERLPDRPFPPVAPSIVLLSFVLTDAGRSAIPEFLSEFAQYYKDHVERGR